MRFWDCLPFALVTFLFSFSDIAAAELQTPWSSSPSPSSTTIVDILNNDTDYHSLLMLLQKALLIPTLNKKKNVVLFAPNNDAIKRHTSINPLWRQILEEEHFTIGDNVQEQLRQQLFYHMSDDPFPGIPAENEIKLLTTLHFPRTPMQPPSRNPPPNPPWEPVPGGTLGGEPQRLRMSSQDQETRVGVDTYGKGGAKVVKDSQGADNGIVIGLSEVLEPPSDLAHVVFEQPSLSYFNKLINPAILQILKKTSELTLFLPVDSAWDNLDPYERLYLESEFATDDLVRILNMHAVVEKHVRYFDSFKPSFTMKTIDGTKLVVRATSKETKVGDARLIQPDIYASNGVLHLVSDLLVPLEMTPEKYLLALNCTTFVSLLRSVDLRPLVNDTETKMTILAPRDDVFSAFGETELPERGSEELKKMLQYHFVLGKWTPEKLENGMLVETTLVEEGLDGGNQVLSVEVTPEDKKKATSKSIRFGGVGVISDSVKVNNALIYFISRPLVPPLDPLQTALPYLDLSSFLAAVFSTTQAETLKSTPRTSLLIPNNEAFKRLGMLVSAHLLSSSSKQDLENVLLHHALDGVEYAQSLQNGSQHTFATLEGSDLKVTRLKNGTYISPSGGWVGMRAELYPRDYLTSTGVIHELTDILIPRSVTLTVGKLVKAAKGSTMATLVIKAGYEWILNGTAPPEGFVRTHESLGASGWTLLCPTDDAFKDYNLTKLYGDLDRLQSIVMQHLIPSPTADDLIDFETDALYNNQPIALDDSNTYSTLRSSESAYGDIVFRQRVEDKQFIVGIKGARGTNGVDDSARVLSWGRSTTGVGGGVIQIDRLLVPYQPGWWLEYGAPSAIGIIGIVLICLFFYGVRLVWQQDTTEATYEPIGGFGNDDES